MQEKGKDGEGLCCLGVSVYQNAAVDMGPENVVKFQFYKMTYIQLLSSNWLLQLEYLITVTK